MTRLRRVAESRREAISYMPLRYTPTSDARIGGHDGGMSNYRRIYVPGGTYFFTVNLLERRRTLLVDRIDLLRDAFRAARAKLPFALIAWVILPDHLHCIWRLPPHDDANAERWRYIKTHFARGIPPGERLSPRRQAKAERGVWQRRYWERLIRDEDALRAHIDYIHINPLKHGHVERVRDWPHSSFHAYVGNRVLPIDWAGDAQKAGQDPPYVGSRRLCPPRNE